MCEEAGRFLVGKIDDADVLPRVEAVSRRHLSLVLSPEAVVVRDKGSTNGTFVNGARIDTQAPEPGDQISITGRVLDRLAPPKARPRPPASPG